MNILEKEKELLREVFLPVFKKSLEWKFNDLILEAISYWFWYVGKIKTLKQYEVEEEIEVMGENWEIIRKVAPVSKTEEIEIDNPIKKDEFVANVFFELLANKSIECIQRYFAEVVSSNEIHKAIDWLKVKE